MLFKALPPSLFHPFTAPGAEAYANILADIYAESQRRPQPLSRDLALDIVLSHLAKSETLARARDTLNYLERCGWLRAETQSDFTLAYTIPDHAFQLLQTIQQMATGWPPPLTGLMVAIHDLLSAAARGEAAEARLAEALRLTQQLRDELKQLQHNPNAGPLEELAHWQKGIWDVTAKLGEAAQPIREHFEAIGRLLRDIESRQRQLAQSTQAEAQPVSAHLIKILNFLSAESNPTGLANSLINFYQLELINSDSLAFPSFPSFPPFPFVPDAAPALLPSAPEIEAAQRETARQLNRPVSRERVRRLAQSLLRDRAEIRAAEIPLSGPADPSTSSGQDPSALLSVAGQALPLLIFLRAYGDGSLGYHVEELEEFTWVEAGGVGFRDFLVKSDTSESNDSLGTRINADEHG